MGADQDGRKFRFDSGNVSSITDRNGNQATIASSGGTTTITDPLGRTTQIASGSITYPGVNGAARHITVNYAALGSVLASGQGLETMAQLFPTLPNESTQTEYDPEVVSSVALPDGSSYTFQYNSYGEVARMTLPTGGAIGYQYPGAMGTCPASGATGCVESDHDSQGNLVGIVERRLLTRYEYANGGTTPTRQTNYTYAVTSQYNTQVTEVDEDGSGNTLRQVQDYLTGDAWTPDVWGTAADYYGDAGTGMRYETVTLSGSGQVLRQEYQTHGWRACAASNWPQTGGGAEPCWWVSLNWPMDHDPQLCAEWTVLSDGSPAPSAATLYQYDQNNNRTDSYEYDYGAGPAASTTSCPAVSGGWTRHVHTAYTGGTYGTFNTGTPVTSAWQPGLASDRQTLNAAGTKVGEQQYSYDQANLVNEPGMVGYSSSFAGVNVGRGNLTTSAAWWNTNNSYPAHTYTYDIAGNVVTDKDANGHTTSYGYADTYSDGVKPEHVCARDERDQRAGAGGEVAVGFRGREGDDGDRYRRGEHHLQLQRSAGPDDAGGAGGECWWIYDADERGVYEPDGRECVQRPGDCGRQSAAGRDGV